jgi:hypothetical protein
MGTEYFPAVNADGAFRLPPTPYSADVKESTQLCLCLHGMLEGKL